jgi:hypothetical protein
VTTGTRDVWERYERDASLFTSGSENAFEALDSAAAGDIAYWVGFQRSQANMRGEDKPVPFDLRVTEIYRRENGQRSSSIATLIPNKTAAVADAPSEGRYPAHPDRCPSSE